MRPGQSVYFRFLFAFESIPLESALVKMEIFNYWNGDITRRLSKGFPLATKELGNSCSPYADHRDWDGNALL